MDEDRSKAEKIIKALEYLNTIISNPVEKACCKGFMERVKELEMERELKCRRLMYGDDEALEKKIESGISRIVGRYGNMSINPPLYVSDRTLMVWEREFLHSLYPIQRSGKSWYWLDMFINDLLYTRNPERINTRSRIIYNKPSETMTLNDVIHWDCVHTDFLDDIKIDTICGFPIHLFSGWNIPDEKRNLNDKTQLERVVKRRK